MPVETQTRIGLKPRTGEKYNDFVFRAHNQLMSSMPDPKNRNKAVWDSWESVNGDPDGERATEYFSNDDDREYKHVRGVPVFMEHSTERINPEDPDGPKVPFHYNFKELCKVLDGSNERCGHDSYSAISSHHTSLTNKGPASEPYVMGFAGPYRLGMVKNSRTNQQKWAIFSDEHRDIAHKETFRNRERRSVEVLRPKMGGLPYFDPIATLGADSPRLPLPLARYQASESNDVELIGVYAMNFDGTIERYEFASPSGSNTFVQNAIPVQRDIYQDPSQMQATLTEPDVRMIIDGLMNTPQIQWVTEQMEAGQSKADPAADPNQMPGQQQNDDDGMSTPNQPPAQASSLPQPSVQAGSSAGGFPFPKQPQQPQRYSQRDDEMTPERYAALENEHETLVEKYNQLSESYQQVTESHTKLVKEHGELYSAVAGLEAKAVDAERTVVLKDLCDRYSHALHIEEELETCLYSNGSELTQEQFSAHCQLIEKIAKRSPIATAMVPNGEFPESSKTKLQPGQSKELHDAVIDRYSQESDRGIHRDYKVIKAEVAREMGMPV